jgi:DNA-binding CsgD family transcriptional regulator
MAEDAAIRLIAEFAKVVLDDPEPEILLSHIAHKTLSTLDCRGVILGAIKREGFLDLIGTYGYANDAVNQYTRMPLWTSLPITDSARSGEFLIFNSPKELVNAYPALAQFGSEEKLVTVASPIKYRNVVIGAVGFTSIKSPGKEISTNPTVDAILALCGVYVRNFLAKRSDSDRDYSEAAKSLSPRQREIINLFEEELTTDQMADKLRYSSSTIKQDIIKIYGIFGVNSRSEVIKLAKRAGLIKSSSK